jgi:hypothetical protein
MSRPTHEINFIKPPIFGELPTQMFEDVARTFPNQSTNNVRGLWEQNFEPDDPLVVALLPLVTAIKAEVPATTALGIEVFRSFSLPGGNPSGRTQEWHYDSDVDYAMTADSITTRQLYIPDEISDEQRLEAIATLDGARISEWFFNQNMIEEAVKDGLFKVAQSRSRSILRMQNAIHQEPTNTTNQPILRTFIRAEILKD